MKKWMVALFFIAGFASANDTVTNISNKLIVACDSSTVISTTGATKIVAGVPARKIYVCGFNLTANGVTAAQFSTGTGTTCATSSTSLSGLMPVSTNTVISYGDGLGTVFVPLSPNQDFCITNSTVATTLSGVVSWTQL